MHTTPTTLEHVAFRLLPGTAPATFVAAARATGAALSRQPGFVARRLTQGPDGLWQDLVEWTDLATAQAAASAMMAEPDFAPFLAMIDMNGLVMRHDTIVWHLP